jgi:hypothetical protein
MIIPGVFTLIGAFIGALLSGLITLKSVKKQIDYDNNKTNEELELKTEKSISQFLYDGEEVRRNLKEYETKYEQNHKELKVKDYIDLLSRLEDLQRSLEKIDSTVFEIQEYYLSHQCKLSLQYRCTDLRNLINENDERNFPYIISEKAEEFRHQVAGTREFFKKILNKLQTIKEDKRPNKDLKESEKGVPVLKNRIKLIIKRVITMRNFIIVCLMGLLIFAIVGAFVYGEVNLNKFSRDLSIIAATIGLGLGTILISVVALSNNEEKTIDKYKQKVGVIIRDLGTYLIYCLVVFISSYSSEEWIIILILIFYLVLVAFFFLQILNLLYKVADNLK